MAMIEAFTKWFESHGGTIHPDVEFAWSRESGFHLRMKEAFQTSSECIEPETTIISCPHALSFSTLNALHAPLFDSESVESEEDNKHKERLANLTLPQEFLQGARPQCVAAVWLCVHFLLQGQSRWHGYVSALPRPPPVGQDKALDEVVAESGEGVGVIDTAMWWTDAERIAIAGTNLARGIEDLETVWEKEWETWKDPLLNWTEKNGLVGLDWRLFKWAISIYGSRAFSSAVIAFAVDERSQKRLLEIHDPHALLYPGVDMLNHSNDTQNGWFCDETRFALVCNDEPSCGEEIFNSYGRKDNGSLLLSFGFAIRDSINDAFALKLPRIKVPALLEKFRACCAPAQVYKSAASSLRFAASTNKGQTPGTPKTPGQTISINETETLLSHDPDHNVFYVRSPHKLLRLLMINDLRPNPGYPELPKDPPYFDHLCGFPSALLDTLAARLANERESEQTMEALSTNMPVSDLWLLLGERNRIALTILLLDRLRMEVLRLESLQDSIAQNLALGSAAPVSEGRLLQFNIYVTYQVELLLENIVALRKKIVTTFASLYVRNDLARDTARRLRDGLETFDIESLTERIRISPPSVDAGDDVNNGTISSAEGRDSSHDSEEEEHEQQAAEILANQANQDFAQREETPRRIRDSVEIIPARETKRRRIDAEQTQEFLNSISDVAGESNENSSPGGVSVIHMLLEQEPVTSELWTLPPIINSLNDFSSDITYQFLRGVLYYTDDWEPDNQYEALVECVDEIRRGSCQWGEEDVFVLWVLAVYVIFHDSSLQASMNLEIHPLIRTLCSFWSRFYGFNKENVEHNLDYDEDTGTVSFHLMNDGARVILGDLTGALKNSDLWRSKLWDDAVGLLPIAKRIVKDETVSVTLSEEEYEVMYNAESHVTDGVDREALDDVSMLVDVNTDEVVTVMAMYLPSNFELQNRNQ